MKAAPLLISWHNENAPIYSAHFEPHGKGRLATAGGDNNVRLWKVEGSGEDRRVTYLSTLVKHTQAVNVVRWCPRGELLGSAGDDGNVLLWVPSETQTRPFGDDAQDDKETWRVKHMCRSFGSEIYDMAWSPDGVFFITGSMDNVARIYNAQTGQTIRQIAEHNHYVQGVAWDPLNEFVATQSSDRSVHIYTLKTKDGQFSLAQHSKVTRMDLPARRISSNSPAPPDFGTRAQFVSDTTSHGGGSPVPSAPGTPNTLPLPMNPPQTTPSRRSSFGSSPSMRRSVSPAPSLPLPAVMPSTSPNIHAGLGVRNTNIYANETLTSFFRRLTFASDGSLLFTPAGQYKNLHPSVGEHKKTDDMTNTVYIYTRAGLNKPPIAYLPHSKPSMAVKCSPVFYALRQSAAPPTKHITVDTSSAEDEIPALPEPAMPSKFPTSHSSMDPPPLTSAPSPSPSLTSASPKMASASDKAPTPSIPAGPPVAFGLPYRMVYGVATQDAVYIYDTQQQTPLCVVSNLHFATFTDLTWSSDGLTLIMTSSDGFCSAMSFTPGELGQPYHGNIPTKQSSHHPSFINTSAAASSTHSTPTPTPTSSSHPTSGTSKDPSTNASSATATAPPSASHKSSTGTPSAPAPPPPASGAISTPSTSFTNPIAPVPARPASPARSMSTSSIGTQSPYPPPPQESTPSTATPSIGAMPGVAAAGSGNVGTGVGGPVGYTPPMTPSAGAGGGSERPVGAGGQHSARSSVSGPVGGLTLARDELEERGTKREGSSSVDAGSGEKDKDEEEGRRPEKRRRIAPTLVSEEAS